LTARHDLARTRAIARWPPADLFARKCDVDRAEGLPDRASWYETGGTQ